jgi:hypothetical protein
VFGFGAIGVNPIGTGPRTTNTTFTLVGGVGSFALTGVAASFKITAPVSGGSFVFTGEPQSFAIKQAANPGDFAFTGVAAAYTIKALASAGSFTLSGSVAEGETGGSVQGFGAFALTGFAATFQINFVPVSGSFVFSGQDAVLTRDFLNWLPEKAPASGWARIGTTTFVVDTIPQTFTPEPPVVTTPKTFTVGN